MRRRTRVGFPVAVAVLLAVSVACKAAEQYPDSVLRELASQCMAQPGATTDRCTCVLDEFQSTFTLEEYEKIVADAKQGAPLPAGVTKIFQDCAKIGVTNTATAPPTAAPAAT